MKRFSRVWEHLGRDQPLGAILTGAGGELRAWDLDDFLATGRADVERLMAQLKDLAPNLRHQRALDFGCGVGRITRALGTYFDRATGVDVARSMIRRARALPRPAPRCEFVVNRSPHLRRFATGTFDLVYSRLVLQHLPPELVRRYIPELVRVLAPGGVLMFQLPAVVEPDRLDPKAEFIRAEVAGGWKRRLPPSLVRLWRRVKYRVLFEGPAAGMEIFGVERPEVIAIVEAAGGRILRIDADRSHGEIGHGYAYWVTCPARAPAASR